MKKLFALVLSIAMVLAIAAPAMAAGWEPFPENPAGLKDITVEVIALEYAPNTTLLGKIWSPLTTSIPVVQGYPVHQVVVVTIPAKKYLTNLTVELIKKLGLDLEVGFSNITVDQTANKPKMYVDAGSGLGAGVEVTLADKTTFEKTFNDVNPGTTENPNADYVLGKTFYFEFWGTVAASGKDAKVDATLGFYNEFKDGKFEFDWDYSKTKEVLYPNYTVTHEAASGSDLLSTFAIDNGNGVVTFTVTNRTEKVNATYPMTVQLYDADGELSQEYEPSQSYTNVIRAFRGADGKVVSSGATFNALTAVCDDIFKTLGFGYENADSMAERYFEHYFGTVTEIESGYNYSTGTVVVVTPDVEPPQTGDNASVIGFVMVAVALVAAAAVTLKKVRA